MPNWTTRIVGLILAILICCTPDTLTAAAQSAASQSDAQPSASPAPSVQQDPGATNTPAAPSQPGTTDNPLPNAPSANSTAENQNTPDQNTSSNTRQQPSEPAGTAAAQIGKLKGGPASKPAGAAIAPAKQRRVRSFLIKFGAIAGAGAALGTVYALSRSSPTRPPGAH